MSALVLFSIMMIGIEMFGLMDPTMPYMHPGKSAKLEQEGGHHCQGAYNGNSGCRRWEGFSILPHWIDHDDASENEKIVTVDTAEESLTNVERSSVVKK
jgi:hypothetical protein